MQLEFPLPELVLALGFLLVLVVEHVVLDCSEQQGDESAIPLLPGGEATAGSGAPHCHPGDKDRSPSPFRYLVLLLGLSLHSVFEGLAVGLRDTQAEVLHLTAAILLHKSAVAFSLALLLFQSHRPLGRLVASVATFVLMTPLGLGLGMAVTEGAGAGGGMYRSVLGAVAAGTFTYITFLEILPQELNLSGSRLPKVLAVLLGFSGMAALRFLG